MTIVRGVPVGEGWLAWKKIVSRFDPKTPAKALLAMIAATQPKKVRDIRDLPSAIGDWESNVEILKEEHNADIDENIKVALLTSMLPSDIQGYVFQKANKDDFAEIRDKVVTLAVNQASLSQGPSQWRWTRSDEGRGTVVNNTTMRKTPRRTTVVSTTLVARAAANTARVARVR